MTSRISSPVKVQTERLIQGLDVGLNEVALGTTTVASSQPSLTRKRVTARKRQRNRSSSLFGCVTVPDEMGENTIRHLGQHRRTGRRVDQRERGAASVWQPPIASEPPGRRRRDPQMSHGASLSTVQGSAVRPVGPARVRSTIVRIGLCEGPLVSKFCRFHRIS